MSKVVDYLKVYDCKNKIRLGDNCDGGYVFIDMPVNSYDCYISAGVSNEESFSRDFINKYNMTSQNSFAFDGTINNYPYEYTKNITFYRKNIAPYQSPYHANLRYFINNYNNIFLKMDIEGWEIHWLNSLENDDLNKFKQIVIEFHGINDDSWNSTYNNKLEVFKKLSETHYLVHIHGNNNSSITNNIPDVIEATYVRKDYFTSKPNLNTTKLPMELDYPCNKNLPDYNLNHYPFVF
jgi:hypothetical protein